MNKKKFKFGSGKFGLSKPKTPKVKINKGYEAWVKKGMKILNKG